MTIGTRDRLVVLLLLAAVDDDDDKRNDEDGKDNVALNNDRLVVVDGINATDNAAAGNRIAMMARKIIVHRSPLVLPKERRSPFFSGKCGQSTNFNPTLIHNN